MTFCASFYIAVPPLPDGATSVHSHVNKIASAVEQDLSVSDDS